MAALSDAALQALRMKYKAVYSAHQACVRALSEAEMSGSTATADLVAEETRARAKLDEARAELLAALATQEADPPAG